MALRKDSTKRVPVPGKRGAFTRETDYNLYLGRLAAVIAFLEERAEQEKRRRKGLGRKRKR